MLNGNKFVKHVYRQDFLSFVHGMFDILHPGVKFIPGIHIEIIAAMLESTLQQGERRIIINIPPRYLKSMIVSVAWPAWLLGINPSYRILCACYSQKLSEKHSIDCRNLMMHDWYKNIFPETKIISSQKHKFITSDHGFRLATSVGGTVTGEGGDVLILDDPHNPFHIHSPNRRHAVKEWMQNTWLSRFNDKNKGVAVLVMQRLHEDDICGMLLNEEANWYHLCLPATAPERQEIRIQDKVYIREKGELLHPARENSKIINDIKKELGTYHFMSQYQQNPVGSENSMLGIEDIVVVDSLPDNLRIFQSWDTAIKTLATNDYSVGLTWGYDGVCHYLIDILREKLDFPALYQQVIRLYEKYLPSILIIEDKASGQSLIQQIRSCRSDLPVCPMQVQHNKKLRFAIHVGLFEAKKICILQKQWTNDYVHELLSFPHAKHDDQVDATAHYLEYIALQQKSMRKPNIRTLH